MKTDDLKTSNQTSKDTNMGALKKRHKPIYYYHVEKSIIFKKAFLILLRTMSTTQFLTVNQIVAPLAKSDS